MDVGGGTNPSVADFVEDTEDRPVDLPGVANSMARLGGGAWNVVALAVAEAPAPCSGGETALGGAKKDVGGAVVEAVPKAVEGEVEGETYGGVRSPRPAELGTEAGGVCWALGGVCVAGGWAGADGVPALVPEAGTAPQESRSPSMFRSENEAGSAASAAAAAVVAGIPKTCWMSFSKGAVASWNAAGAEEVSIGPQSSSRSRSCACSCIGSGATGSGNDSGTGSGTCVCTGSST